jgi:hypothetical protein
MERIVPHPVDGVDITTVVDNSSDVLLPDEGLVRRWGPAGTAGVIPVVPTELAEGGKTVDFLRRRAWYRPGVRRIRPDRDHDVRLAARGGPGP